MKLQVLPLVLGLSAATSANAWFFPDPDIKLEPIGVYQNDPAEFDEGEAEIVVYDAQTKRVFKVNANAATIEVLNIQDPRNPVLVGTINATTLGANANSVAVKNGIVAVAIEAEDKQAPGSVAFYNAGDLSLVNNVTVGALPDMVTFTPNGRYALVANEGEPNDDYTVDPEGSVSIISLRKGVANATVKTATFTRFNDQADELRAAGVRIFGPGATVAQDLEPEFITISRNSRTAWVALQEANALAKVNIRKAEITDILPLGTKDHSLPGNELDASNRDDAINITNWPVKGFYMPDSIDSYNFKGKTYIVTANEGDSRDYDGFSEEERIKDLVLDPAAFPNAAFLQEDENLGRLKTTSVNGDRDGDGDFDELYSYGARSFSIWTASGKLVYDSGADFENITALADPDNFNSTNDENGSFDNRSDDKGPEPEGVVIGRILGKQYAMIGLERVGGIMVYDITNPHDVQFKTYLNNRNFDVEVVLEGGAANPQAKDLGPEGLTFIPWYKSPIKRPLLVVGNEVSGTTTIYQIKPSFD